MTDRPPWRGAEGVDLAIWLALSAVGIAAVILGARHLLHTDAAPFLGSWRFAPTGWLLAAAALAAAVLLVSYRVGADSGIGFGPLAGLAYLAALGWALALSAGTELDSRLRITGAAGEDPLRLLRDFVGEHRGAQGHPPGPALLLWALHQLAVTGRAAGVVVTALGALAVPLMLVAARSAVGEVAARRLAPVLVLAPYAVFAGGAMDGVAAALGAGMAVAGARASEAHCTGRRATGWALVAGLALGLAAMFSYAAPWLGLSVVFLYFARRRPFLNLATGLGALVVPVAGTVAGFSWLAGLLAAHAGYTRQPASELLWGPVSLVTLLLCAGPALVASLRKLRNTPGWPFLAGAGLAVAFSVLAGFARGGAETAWLPFFGWLTIAVTAPERQAGPPVAVPRLLAGAGALVALTLAATVTP